MRIMRETKDKDLEFYINKYLNNHLGSGEEHAKVEEFEVKGDKVVVKYYTTVSISYPDYDSDGYETTKYDYETDYRTDEFSIKEIMNYGKNY